SDAEKINKQLQHQIHELQVKNEEGLRTLNDYDATKKKLALENADLLRQLEEAEAQLGSLSKLKLSLSNHLDDTKKVAEEECRLRATLLGKYRNLEHDIDGLREQLDEENEIKTDMQRMLSKASAEVLMWRSKYESEGVARAEELEAARIKLSCRLEEAEAQIEQLNVKNLNLEKNKQRTLAEFEEMQIAVERGQTLAYAAEKKQKNFEKIIGEWKLKVDDLAAELDASQKEHRNLSTENFHLNAVYEEKLEQFESIRRENKGLSDEIRSLSDQVAEGGRNLHESEKLAKRYEAEKEELQAALEEAETALEQEENKVLRNQLELDQVRQEIDRRIQEKEEEFDNTRKCHQRAMDSMQASLEAEAKAKTEALHMKKKLETDIHELEAALDHSNKTNADMQKFVKKTQGEYKELQTRYDEERRLASEYREQLSVSERRANSLQGELEEARTLLEQSDRGRRNAESELSDANTIATKLSSENSLLSASKRKLEGEHQTLQADLDEMLSESRNSEDKAKKAMIDAARLLRNSRFVLKRVRGTPEDRRRLPSLRWKIVFVNWKDNWTKRHHSEAQQNLRKCERRMKELSFQSDEDRKNHEKMQDLVDKLQQKVRTYKRQIEEAEEIAALNLAKY
ncbi:Myosin heavy chain, muscle-like 12, partial [Homarus americanus]